MGGEKKELTMREAEVVRLIADGLPSKEIADRLGIAFGTVVTKPREISVRKLPGV